MNNIFEKFAPRWRNAVARFARNIWQGEDDQAAEWEYSKQAMLFSREYRHAHESHYRQKKMNVYRGTLDGWITEWLRKQEALKLKTFIDRIKVQLFQKSIPSVVLDPKNVLYFPDFHFETHPDHRKWGAVGEDLLRQGFNIVFYSINIFDLNSSKDIFLLLVNIPFRRMTFWARKYFFLCWVPFVPASFTFQLFFYFDLFHSNYLQ